MVDGLERSLGKDLDVARVDVGSDEGSVTAARYGVHAVPAFVLLDRKGKVVYRKEGGRPDGTEIARIVASMPR